MRREAGRVSDACYRTSSWGCLVVGACICRCLVNIGRLSAGDSERDGKSRNRPSRWHVLHSQWAVGGRDGDTTKCLSIPFIFLFRPRNQRFGMLGLSNQSSDFQLPRPRKSHPTAGTYKFISTAKPIQIKPQLPPFSFLS